jgi:hypothetical protein
MDECRLGTIHIVSATFGNSTKELMTVVSPSISISPDALSELFIELQDLWPIVQPL